MRLKTRNKGQFSSPELVFFVQICFQLPPSLSLRPTQTPTHRLSTSHLHPLLFFCLSFARSRSVNTHTSLNPSARANPCFFLRARATVSCPDNFTPRQQQQKKRTVFVFCLVQEMKPQAAGDHFSITCI